MDYAIVSFILIFLVGLMFYIRKKGAVDVGNGIYPIQKKQIYQPEFEPAIFSNAMAITLENVSDNRVFSDFPEISVIDRERKAGNMKKALSLTHEGIKKYPDSFLFYGRASEILINSNELDVAEELQKKAILYSKVKTYACDDMAKIALRRGNIEGAVVWWLRACHLQLKENNFNYPRCFLSLYYICLELGREKTAHFFMEKAAHCGYGALAFDKQGKSEQQQIARRLQQENMADVFLVMCNQMIEAVLPSNPQPSETMDVSGERHSEEAKFLMKKGIETEEKILKSQLEAAHTESMKYLASQSSKVEKTWDFIQEKFPNTSFSSNNLIQLGFDGSDIENILQSLMDARLIKSTGLRQFSIR